MPAATSTPRDRSVNLDTTGQHVRDAVKSLRKAAGLTHQQVTDRTGGAISRTAISDIERGVRKVDVDDLMHLALALDVSPLDLLLPERTDPGAHPITGATPRQTRELWAWATEGGALTGPGATMRWQVLNTLRTTLERQSREHTERMTEIAHWQRLVRILTEALHADDGARVSYLNRRLDEAHESLEVAEAQARTQAAEFLATSERLRQLDTDHGND